MVNPRKEYLIVSDSGETHERIAIFNRAAVEAEFGDVSEWETDRIIGELVEWRRFYRGPGRPFAHDPTMRVMGRNIVIQQYGGLDI